MKTLEHLEKFKLSKPSAIIGGDGGSFTCLIFRKVNGSTDNSGD